MVQGVNTGLSKRRALRTATTKERGTKKLRTGGSTLGERRCPSAPFAVSQQEARNNSQGPFDVISLLYVSIMRLVHFPETLLATCGG